MRRALGTLLGVCGVVVLATSSTLGAVFFGFSSWLTRAPLGFALACLALSAVLSRRGLAQRLEALRTRVATETLVVAALVAGLVVGANVLAQLHPVQLDLTTARVHALSERTVHTLAGLRDPVRITAFFEPVAREATEVRALVERYRAVSDRVSLRVLSPTHDVAEAQALHVALGASEPTAPNVVVEVRWDDQTKHRDARFALHAGGVDHEEQLTNALVRVSSSTRPRIYFTTGHGEAEPQSAEPAGLQLVAGDLANEGHEVVELPLAAAGAVPDDAAAVVVAGPTVPFTPSEAALLDAYVRRGGGLLLLLEPPPQGSNEAGLGAVLGAAGVQANADVVLDLSPFGSVFGGPDTAAGVAYGEHPITKPLGSAMTLFRRARSLSLVPIPDTAQLELVKTGDRAWGEASLATGAPPVEGAALGWNDGEVQGPLALAVAIERASEPREDGAPRRNLSRVVVVGDASFATNQYLGAGQNRALLEGALDWLAADGAQVAVRPRTRAGNVLFLTPTQREGIAFATLYVLPTALLCLGLTAWLARRRR